MAMRSSRLRLSKEEEEEEEGRMAFGIEDDVLSGSVTVTVSRDDAVP